MRYSHPDGHVFYRSMNFARPMIERGEGVYLFDKDGNQYIDGSGGPLVVNVGHGRQAIVDAISEQAAAAAYVHGMMFTSDPLEEYAAALAEVVPLDDPRFFLLSSGSEVVEGAIKLARQIQMARGESKRHLIISRWNSYHGMTLGALGVSGRPGLRAPYLPMLHDMPHIASPYPYRSNLSGEALAAQLEETIRAYGEDQVAAFIAEPISGASLGAVVPPDSYWPAIREICDRTGVLLIADEVLAGMGRTGRWWGLDHWNVRPDILVTSKGTASGYFPLGFIAAQGQDVEAIRTTLGDFNHGGTYSHHAVGAAAGLATLQIIQDEGLVERSAQMGDYLGQLLHDRLQGHPLVGDIRGRGLFWGIELVADRATRRPFSSEDKLARRIWQSAFESGLIIYYSQGCADGKNGDILMLGPPFIINETQCDQTVEMLATAISDVTGL